MRLLFLVLISCSFSALSQQVKVARIVSIDMAVTDTSSYPIITLNENGKEWQYEVQIPEFVAGDDGPVMEIIYTFDEYENVQSFVYYEEAIIESYKDKNAYLIYANVGFNNWIILYSIHKQSEDLANISTRESSLGAWSVSDIENAASVIFEFRQDFLDLYDKNAYLIMDCYLISAMNSYTSFEEADKDLEGCTVLINQCIDNYSFDQEYDDAYYDDYYDGYDDYEMEEIDYEHYYSDVFLAEYSSGKSKKGNWNLTDKQKAIDVIESVIESLEDSFGYMSDDFIICYLSKAENNYKSFDEADVDYTGMEELAKSCSQEIYEEE